MRRAKIHVRLVASGSILVDKTLTSSPSLFSLGADTKASDNVFSIRGFVGFWAVD